MRKLILCVGEESPYDEPKGHWTYCVSMTEAYAKRHAIDFKYIQAASILDRNASWSRIPTVLKYIDEYDEILCVNSAVGIINHEVDVFTYLKTANESEWVKKANAKPILYTVVDKPTNKKHACSAIFLLDCENKDAAKEVMEDWWNDCPEKRYETEKPYEQSVLNLAWTKDITKASRLRVADIWTAQEYDNDQVFIHIIDAYKLMRVFEAQKYFYRLLQKQPCKKRIGIFVRQQNYYTNGAGQNCIFMKQSLEATGHNVDLIVYNMDKTKPFVSNDMPYIYKDYSTIDLDFYCTMIVGSFLPPKSVLDQIKARKIELVMFNPCNPFDQFHNDNFLYTCKSSASLPQEMLFHTFASQVWITENHKETGKTYLEVVNKNKIPINPVPLIWNPLFLYHKGQKPRYTDRSKKQADIVIIEPNINYCKSGWLPLVISEKLYLEQPDSIRSVYFFNAPDNNPSAMGMIKSLKLYEDGKVKLLSRMQINEILDHFAKKTDDYPVVFLSHQIHLPMNYAYYDILSSGFPFVHNSKVLNGRGLGYYYKDGNITDATQAIKRAIDTHNVSGSLAHAKSFLYENDPYHPDVIKTFQSLLHRPIKSHARKLLHITYDNNPTKGTEFLLETLERNKWEYQCVGKGDIWQNWKTRAKGYKQVLDTLDDQTIVVCTDARDVVCLRDSNAFLEAFDSFDAEFIVSMEITGAGVIGGSDKHMGNCIHLTDYWKYHKREHNLPFRRFVNAGLYCGKAKAVRQFINWFLDSEHSDDQYALGHYMNMFPQRVCADIDAKILHTTNFGINGGIQNVQTQATDSPTFAELCGRAAFFLHMPHGVSKGQEYIYNKVCSVIQIGVTEADMNDIYALKKVGWSETHATK